MTTTPILHDDWFSNINLMNDPAISYMPDVRRNDYIISQLAENKQYAASNNTSLVDFDNDIWDLNQILHLSGNTILHFSDLPEEVKTYLKFFINFYRKNQKVKPSSIYLRYTNIKNFVNGILSKHTEVDFAGITTKMLSDYVDNLNYMAETLRVYVTSLFMFYDYLIRICKIPLLVDLSTLNQLKKDAVKKAIEDDTRLPNIPKPVAEAIRNKAELIMLDEQEEYSSRLVACAIIMLFELGVRIQDLLDFKITDLYKEAAVVQGYKISYITYFINKLSRHNSEGFGHYIYASKVCVEAFETLLKIRTAEVLESEFLFVLGDKQISKNKFGNELYPLYMYKFHPDICTTDKYSEVFTSNSSCYKSPVNGQTLYFPETRQYRVHLCTELLARGVSWNFVEEHIKHLSSMMANYYNRPEDHLPEYIAYAENVLKTMLVDDVDPIGVAGAQFKENIAQFLKDKNVNVVRDFDAVLKTLGDKVSIRAKTGGFCFKTSLVPCSQELGSNKMLCAYNLCPNVYSFYYMLDYSYIQFKAHIEAFEQNFFKGLINSAQKELIDIKSLINRTLSPQIKQLEEQISKVGIETVLEQHPNIIEVTSNLDNIKKEISVWKQKNVK